MKESVGETTKSETEVSSTDKVSTSRR